MLKVNNKSNRTSSESVQNSYGLYYGKLWLLRETNSDLSGRTLLRPTSTRISSQLEKISNELTSLWSCLVPRRKLEQVMRNLTCGNQQILFMVIRLVLTRVETEEISCERLGSCFSWTCFREWGESVGGQWRNWIYFFGHLLLGGSNAEKWSDHKKKKFFINNSIEVVISFK